MKRLALKSGLALALSLALFAGANDAPLADAWHMPAEASNADLTRLEKVVLTSQLTPAEVQGLTVAQLSYLLDVIQKANPSLPLDFSSMEPSSFPRRQAWLAQANVREKLPEMQRLNEELIGNRVFDFFERLGGLLNAIGSRPFTNADVENLDIGELYFISITATDKANKLNSDARGGERWSALGPYGKTNLALIGRYSDYLQEHGRHFGR